MAEASDHLEAVKNSLGITGEYQDNVLKAHIAEVSRFLTDAGVPEDVVSADTCDGIIARGVADLWAYGSGDGTLSPYFMQRATQLAFQAEET